MVEQTSEDVRYQGHYWKKKSSEELPAYSHYKVSCSWR
ncbi:MAG: hypothetical protein OJF50_004452 [Nitrospira sp.]|nr:hypothetical protein [Nitrospira sp.]